jgi:hypothetical protein
MLFNRKKNREADSVADIQRLKQEIRNELARIHGGVYEEPQAAEAAVAGGHAALSQEQPELHHDPAKYVPAPRTQSISSSPLIQRAALGQIGVAVPQAANGGGARHDDDSPFGAFRHLVERFEAAAGRIETQIDRLDRMSRGPAAVPTPEPARVQEPRFGVDAPALQIALAGVPNFQALMDVQRALGSLTGAGDATVSEFDQDEASLQLALREPMSLSEIMEGLRESSGHPLLVEESRPEAGRLRLRFIPQPAARPDVLNPDLWAKA